MRDFFEILTQSSESGLLPRRQEILNIVQDHPYISLDSIARRFPAIPHRTIGYDVNQLIKARKIIKHGKTRGVVYTAISNLQMK